MWPKAKPRGLLLLAHHLCEADIAEPAVLVHRGTGRDRVGFAARRPSIAMGADVRLVDEGFDIGIRKSWPALDNLTTSLVAAQPPATVST